ncbi:MAG: N-6 DNA methylase [Aquihabitans sp.]
MTPGGRSSSAAAAAVISVMADAAQWVLPTSVEALVGPLDRSGRLVDETARAWSSLTARGAVAGPHALGLLYEALLDPEDRDAGAHYTSSDLAGRLVALVVEPDLVRADPTRGRTADSSGAPRVWDPACGGGAFLLAAADALVAAGTDPTRVVADCLWGCDVDEGAVIITQTALTWWAERAGARSGTVVPAGRLVVADALLDQPFGANASFDLVVGNPPFQGQLSGAAVRSGASAAALRERWGDVVGPYTDTSALFLVAGASVLAPGGRMVLVQPASVMSARDASASRAAATDIAPLVGLWVATESVFAAAVDVCAPVLARAVNGFEAEAPTEGAGIQRWRGRTVEPVGTPAEPSRAASSSWAALALVTLGVPDPTYLNDGLFGDVAVLSAGFRDEYYGLVDHVAEAPSGFDPERNDWPEHLAPLITSGLIETGWGAWGSRSTRFARRRFERPVIDRRSLSVVGGRAHQWASSTAVPKVIVATQTRVGEAMVDESGLCIASTPTVVAIPDGVDLWKLAAVICSPVGTVAALAATAGSGRSARAIKHSVTSVGQLPLPVDHDAWGDGAEALRVADQDAFVDAMASAYAVGDRTELHDWWRSRVPWSPT